MDALGPDPRVRAHAALQALMAGIDAAPLAATPGAARAPWYQRLLSRIVRVQPTAGAGLGQRPEREVALAALQVEASLARVAIERRDAAALAIALARIDAGLQALLAGTPALAQKRRLVADLKALPLRVESPLAGSSLLQLRALRGG
jgi:uroporphyrin-3 C-methyltransferase